MSGNKYLLKKQWNEAEFLAELKKRSGATAREVAEGLLRWFTPPQVTDVAWGLGSNPPGGVPFIQHGKTKYLIGRMATDGHFVFRFDYLSANPPFSNKSLMGQLMDKINEIPGVVFPDDVRARIPYEKLLTTSDALKKLKSAVAFVIEQVKDRVRISQEDEQCPTYSLHKQEFGCLSVDERVDKQKRRSKMGIGKYPWNDWFKSLEKGKSVTLKRGDDYRCLTRSFTVMCYTQARFRDLKIHCKSIGEDQLQLTLNNDED